MAQITRVRNLVTNRVLRNGDAHRMIAHSRSETRDDCGHMTLDAGTAGARRLMVRVRGKIRDDRGMTFRAERVVRGTELRIVSQVDVV